MIATPSLVQSLQAAPAFLLESERLLLYTLVRSLRPRRILEIGVLHGGSTAIITRALDDNGEGTLWSVDPVPAITIDWNTVAHRATLYKGYSPDVLPEVARAAGGCFDLCFIDANHAYGCVLKDAQGVMAYMARGGYLLFHDAHFREVKGAIDDFVATRIGVDDCGLLSTAEAGVDGNGEGPWGGLRLVRVRSNRGIAFPSILSRGRRYLWNKLHA
ncbi:MAG: class I SAM-dependent methyltransferase [Nitrospiraceae bacterium]